MQTKIEKISVLSALSVNNIKEVSQNQMTFLSCREKLSLFNISHLEKRKESLAARLAIKYALDCMSIPYPGFYKDEHGKSHAMDGSVYVSLTHTKGFAAAIFHKEMPVGIDMEYVKDKVVRLGPKFLHSSEIDFLDNDPLLYTIAWSAKESIYKCQGRKGISLKDNILLRPFTKEDRLIFGEIYHTDNSNHFYQIKVMVENDMVLTYTVW